jgi:hypothetical protein
MTLEALLAPPDPSSDLLGAFAAKGWPADLARRAAASRMGADEIGYFLGAEARTADDLARSIDDRERLTTGSLRLREATSDDRQGLVDLFANSPEEIGDWEVTVERGPYSYAQFRLQENVQIQVLEERGVVLAALARSVRNAIVDGQRVTVQISEAARVRSEARGRGYSNFVRRTSPMGKWYVGVDYLYVRDQNFNAFNWVKTTTGSPGQTIEPGQQAPGLTATIHCYMPARREADTVGIRKVKRGDLPGCVALINQTHRGLDLFRPYSAEFLRRRLDDPCWGAKPDWWTAVYGWDDYYVVEEGGRMVACAGLWDRGRHVREVWCKPKTGEREVLECTALLDFGWAPGREEAMARLVRHLVNVTSELGRSRLMAPFEPWPELLDRLSDLPCVPDRRNVLWRAYVPGRDGRPLVLRRSDTDLAYW